MNDQDMMGTMDFESVGHQFEVSEALGIKISQNRSYVGMISKRGFRIYTLKGNEPLRVREGEGFSLYRQSKCDNLIRDMEFMGDTLAIILSVEGKGLVIWQDELQEIVATYDFMVPDSVSYCFPYIFAVYNNAIIVFNQARETMFKYILNPTPLNQNPNFLPKDQHKKRYLFYVHNKVSKELVFSYLSEGILMIENFTRQMVIGLDIQDLQQVATERILAVQDIQLSLIEGQQSQRQLNPVLSAKPSPSIYVEVGDNQIAVSKFEGNQSVRIFDIDWMTGKLQLLRTLYRGAQPKELSIHFGPNGLIGLLSFEGQYTKDVFDATLHLYYPNSQTSTLRLYFKTWTNYDHPHDRLIDTLLHFPSANSLQIISINNFMLFHHFNMQSQVLLREQLKDQHKVSWQNVVDVIELSD